MNPKEIINHEPKIFPSAEAWNAFNELVNARQSVVDEWYRIATQRLQKELSELLKLNKDWSFCNWDHDREIKVYLKEFGDESLLIGFGWQYQFHLYLFNPSKFNTTIIDELLRADKFTPVLDCVDNLDKNRLYEEKTKAMSNRNFRFGSVNDGRLDPNELAWHAGNETDEFVKQALEQIEKFTSDTHITELMIELNRQAKISP
ncbi:hypothetical protein ACWPKO_04055 [Coraliomargarita sp. W4R53]